MARRATNYDTFGHRLTVVAQFPDTDAGTKEANAYMLANPGAALLAAHEGQLYLVNEQDKGQKLARPYAEGPVFTE